MDNSNEPDRKPPEKRNLQQGNNLIWIMVGAVVVLVLLLTTFTTDQEETIPYSNLVELIKTGATEVTSGRGPKQRTVRYANLEKIEIWPRRVTGEVTVVRLSQASPAPPSGDRTSQVTPTAAKASETVPFRTDRDTEEKALSELLLQHGVQFSYAKGPSAWSSYVPVLLLMSACLLLFFVMLRRMGGAGSPMAFGRSRGKLYAQEDISVTFESVAGIDEAVEELREVVEFLKTPEKYQILGGRIPKGVLLIGPPGTGKTLLAKAIAGEAGVPFFSLSGSDFVEMFVGVGAARVRDMFQQAEQKAPCIIFIDELDALGKTRGSSIVGGHDEREQTLNALLVELDGFESNSGVIVLGATNRPETLDPALLRPGRFDRHVLVDRPDVAGRKEILEVHLQKVKVDGSVDVQGIAAITSGFVGADLANLVNEAALLAARKGKLTVGMGEFNEAVERLSAGLEKKKRIMHEDEKQRVAYHEAGHALLACCLPNTDPVHKVSIIPRGLAALGYTMQRPEQDRYLMTQAELESRIQVLLAGTLTEEIIFEDVSTGAQNDLERATEIARSMIMDYGMSRLGRVTFRESNRSPFLAGSGEMPAAPQTHSEQTFREIDQEVKRIIDKAIDKVRHILEVRRDALVAIAAQLLKEEVIDAKELKAIIEENSPSPMIVPGTDAEPKTKRASDPESSSGELPSGADQTGSG
jgi:cell division protease FtsH